MLDKFITKANIIHSNKYTYEKAIYTKYKEKLEITCPIHGSFFQSPEKHINRGTGCPSCSGYKKIGLLGFIEKANKIHNNKYDYSKVRYDTIKHKVLIICPIHGDFEQTPDTHINKSSGCPSCSPNKKLNSLDFINKAIQVHGNQYDYSNLNYINSKIHISIICKVHGEYEQTPDAHINQNQGCPSCANNKKITTIDFINKAIQVHGDLYDYSETEYTGINNIVKIKCIEHGYFLKIANLHLFGQGCKLCSFKNRTLTNSDFINKAIQVHGDLYDYSKVEYIHNREYVDIICKVHGVFKQSPNVHVSQQSGCPKCTSQISKAQIEIYEFIKTLNSSAILEDRTTYPGLLLDITIPEKNLAVEYNGVYWHAINHEETSRFKQNNHLKDKMIKANAQGLRVINIYEDEWINSRPHIEQILKNALGVIDKKIAARKCTIWSITTNDPLWETHITPFFTKFHHQGLRYKFNGVAYCLVYENQIQACAYFGVVKYHNQSECELIRYATRSDMKIVGGLSKLVINFLRQNPNIKRILSFCDARLFTGEGYLKSGFSLIKHSKPGFNVIVNGIRKHRSCIIKKNLTNQFTKDDLYIKSQKELADDLGWHVVPDCGQLVFEYKSSFLI